ncbi:unnamed protein product [Triticum turgidum subsp. durum]|uniref:Uncharacterized protein n=1 Tax=Triticum turgidum subsp. durum TaxID=4567 RepID=A0A9R0TDD3_TRITD|nr:unnamed protein product [Triticum turgidum subsp. durum]
MVTPAEAVGGMLASAVIKVVIGQISSSITGEIKLHKNMRKDLENMKMTLESVEAVLSDAETRSIKHEPTRLWLNRLKHAANDIADMLEDFEDDTDLNLWAATMKKIRMPRKMKKVQKRLEKIKDDHNNYGFLTETHRKEQPVTDIRETAGSMVEEEIIGRDAEILEIMACLSGSTTQGTTIIPIWGIAGIGKTTLARWVFNDSQFKEYSRVWVYVSQIFDLKKIGNTILSQLSQQSPISDLHGVHTRLRELFTGKKILIILDDLWENDLFKLKELKDMLKLGEGSKVMVVVTTREESIAKETGTIAPSQLPPLTDEICWDIIKQKCNFEARPDRERLEPIGKEIATKCGGVALAAQSLGHMLKCRPYEEWDAIKANHIWELSTSEDTLNTQEVLASLLLSYNLMPPRLKLCFAYCAIFQKGHNMIKDDLIHQWIALGFINHPVCSLPGNAVRVMLGSFCKCPFFRTLERKDATRFTMHDLVHDLARSVTAEEFDLEGPNCRYACRTDCEKPLKPSPTSPAKLRALHIVDHAYKETEFHHDADSPAKYIHVLDLHRGYWHELPDSIGQLKQLRYLSAPLISGQMNPRFIGMLSKLNYLNLHHCGLSTLPESIGEMKGLMHLDLSSCKSLKELPLSFRKLTELLYLDLSNCDGLLGIPQALGGLTKLQHLDLSQCQNLGELPEVIRKLTELRYLNLSWCMHHIFDSSSTGQAESFIECICLLPNMEQLHLSCQYEYPLSIPKSATCLSKLALDECYSVTRIPERVAKMDTQSLFGLLPDFSVYSDGTEPNSNLHLLEHTNPERLSITMLENVKFIEEAHIINLREKSSIVDLRLGWTEDGERYVEDMELLRELVPPTTLQGFEIYGYCSLRFPDWLMSIICYLPNLARIRLSDLPNCKTLPPLGQLPNLRELILGEMKSLEEWNTSSWSGEDSVNELMFPKLEKVYISYCPRLRIKPHLPRAASWSVVRSDSVLISCGDSVAHTDASSSSSPVSTRLEVSGSNLPLHQWSLLHHLPAHSDLDIYGCSDLAGSPEIIQALHSLKALKLNMADSEELVEWFADLTSLQHLTLWEYKKLEQLPANMRQLTQLESLSLYGCQRMTSLPEWLGELTSLRKLEILWCFAIKTLPESIQQLSNLQQLKILGNPELRKWCAEDENKAKLAHTESDKDEATMAEPAEPQHCGCLRF